MRAIALILGLLVATMSPSATYASHSAAGGNSSCHTYTWGVDAGKSADTFKASATDGCHTYNWTNVQGQNGTSGSVTFKTSHVLQVWEKGSTLPQPNGEGGWCAYQAAHEANMHFVFYFDVPDGTEVTVKYACT